MCVGTSGGQRCGIPPELEFQEAVKCLMWVLGASSPATGLGSDGFIQHLAESLMLKIPETNQESEK